MKRKFLLPSILLFMAVVLGQPCWAAFTISNHGVTWVAGTSVTTSSFNQAAGDLLYVACFSQAATTAHTVSDLNGDTFTLINSKQDTVGSNYFTSWYAVNVTAKTGNTITCQGGSGSQTATIAYMDLAGAATVSALDAHSTVNIADNSSTCTTNSMTTTNAVDFIVTTGLEGQTGNAATNWSASSGYTIEDALNPNGQNKAFGIDAYRTTSSAGAYTDTLNNGGNPPGGNWMCEAVAFNSPGSGSTPNITSLSPTSGAVGTSVTITGSNFGSSQGSSTVTFNGTTATASSWTANSITATVPTGATTGNVVVTVNGVASNGVSFTVTASAFTISSHGVKWVAGTSVTTPSFNQAAGDLLYVACFSQAATTQHTVSDLNGDTFTLINSQKDTTFGSNYFTSWYAVNVTAKTGNTITCQGGSGSQTATIIYMDLAGAATASALDAHSTVNIADNSSSCTTNSITTTNAVDFIVTTGLEGQTGNAATNWSASSGYTIEDTLNPNGQNKAFGIDAYRTTSSAGTYTDTLNNGGNPPGGNWMCEAVAFNSSASGSTPNISSLSPTSGAVGTSVTIAGSNFGSSQGSSTVKFNGTTATASSWTANSITATVPSGATTGNVVVTVNGVASNGVSFTVTAAPSITSLSPTSGAVGASVTIAGSNFGSSQGNGGVKFNGTAATVNSWSNTSITATVPTGATTGNVVVTAAGGVASNGISFTVTAAPSITNLSPTSGAVGTSVTITGSNFGSSQGSSTVTFNGTTATASSWTASSITATVPSGATTGNVVVTVSGMASNGVSFTVAPGYNFKVTYAPNGNVLTANDSVNGNWIYTYDDFNRLATSNNSSPTQGFSYAYDELGNRWQQNLTAGSGGTSSLTFSNYASATTNGNCYHAAGRTNQPDNSCYDAAGNLLSDGTHSYTYDAENRLISVDGGPTATYTYAGDGSRIRKVSSAGTADYLYDLEGRSITELSGSGGWNRGEVYAGSRHLATYRNGTTYLNQVDWLGTERTLLALNGSPCETSTNLAFGDALTSSGSCGDPSPDHFTGDEHDSETNLEHTMFRQYASTQGRWTTPDPFLGSMNLTNPQSLNRYSFVLNNPLRFVDPLGLEPCENNDDCQGSGGGGDSGGGDNGGSGGGDNGGGGGLPKEPVGPPIIVVQVWEPMGPNSPPPPDMGAFNCFEYGLCPGGQPPATGPGDTERGGGGRGGPAGRPANDGTSRTAAHCVGQALKKNGISVVLDVAGAIPAFGNVVSGGAAVGRIAIGPIIDGVVTYGGGAYGVATGIKDDTPYGAVSAAYGLGFSLAGAALEGSKVIPVVGNVVSGLTGLYDIYQGYKTYQQCMAGQ